jgi:murein DD-endopeptidase MepM/ murein hydrolase activator NlpD
LGLVGTTGKSSGPHLHFEVRLGENSYFNTRNPELWMVPPEGWGVLAGRVTSTWGERLPEQLIRIRALEGDGQWRVWTYRPETVNPDDIYNENFVISDLPAGPYEISINYLGRVYRMQMYLYPGRTNLIQFRGRNGFIPLPEGQQVDLSAPPLP